ncbi:hypothetical protein DPMN_019377 [Dreissena polymorpha]|uniref:Uncharacterized protein n=1 Tax=Dreissena polymorpha TaxID=45954 RepID=A0A9D4SA58_DREPO|nr:hypothetical protein DPMN_019377 [Dreissena polymorpha]
MPQILTASWLKKGTEPKKPRSILQNDDLMCLVVFFRLSFTSEERLSNLPGAEKP